jgi:acid phosphatase
LPSFAIPTKLLKVHILDNTPLTNSFPYLLIYTMKVSTLALIFSSLIACAKADGTTTTSSKRVARTYSTIQPSASDVAAAAQNAATLQWTSDVKGKSFDRFVVIWLENTDFDQAAEEPNMAWVASQGITLTNYWALTHPSEPNYMASVGGDYFSLNDDRMISLPKNVSTIVDLLDDKGISFASYQEDLPYTGYQGFNYSNQQTFAKDYVRKHDPLMLYDSYTSNSTRLSLVKNFTEFERDLKDEKLPQYMIITPNMTNDAHDTNMKVAGKWTRDFMTPLLENEYFINNTLVLITFDENETKGEQNTVYSILLGGAISDELKGTTDETFYDHYSQIASVEVNWDLYNLGRNDVTANIWKSLADAENITNNDVDTRYMVNNATYVGYLLDDEIALPAPNVSATNIAGKGILPAISSVWADEYNKQVSESYFTSTTTLNSVVPTLTNGASLFESNASTKLGSASTASSAKPVASASASASESASSAKPSSANAAAGIAPATGIAGLAAMAMALLI